MMAYVTTMRDLFCMFELHKKLCEFKRCNPLNFDDFTLVFIESGYTDIQSNAFRKLTKLVKNDD